LVANYHAPEERNIVETEEILKGFGIQKIRIQREVFNAQLYFELLNLSKIGDLSRMTQYKSTPEDERTGQLLTYPVLMAHDVAGYEEVLVGADQCQHLEYARKLLKKYNKVTGMNYLIPVGKIKNARFGKITDLRNPLAKMSKSSPAGCLFLDDTPDDIRKKLRQATMDFHGRYNLESLYEEFVGGKPPESNQQLKEELAEGIIDRFKS
jgi:tryptophanyl-tRNA synthetase